MAIAQLSKVVLVSSRKELGAFLAALCQTGMFHPSDETRLVQDTELVLLASDAHEAYSVANTLLRGKGGAGAAQATLTASSMTGLVADLKERARALGRDMEDPALSQASGEGTEAELVSIRDAALTVFKDLSRLRVRPGTRRFLVFEGFVPTRSVPSFSSALGNHFVHSEPIPHRQEGVPYVPSLMVNPRVVSLFEDITLSVGVPRYNEVDPTPIVAFVFPLFFGIMFSDLGRGLILLLGGLYFRKNKKESYRYLGRLLVVLGASAMFVGLLRGLFFGVRLPYPALLPSPSFLVQGPSLQTVTFWLEVGIVIGTFHLAAGYLLATANRVLSKEYAEAFLGYAPTLVMYSAAIPFAFALLGVSANPSTVFTSQLPTPFFTTLLGVRVPVWLVADVTLPILLASVAVLILGRPLLSIATSKRTNLVLRALGKGVADAVVRPAELFVHTISYIRLGILLVVESVFGELLAGIALSGPVGVIVAIPGNLLVVSIMAFIVYLQDLRLNVYEWFSKFYSGVGRPFSPLVSRGPTFRIDWGLSGGA